MKNPGLFHLLYKLQKGQGIWRDTDSVLVAYKPHSIVSQVRRKPSGASQQVKERIVPEILDFGRRQEEWKISCCSRDVQNNRHRLQALNWQA